MIFGGRSPLGLLLNAPLLKNNKAKTKQKSMTKVRFYFSRQEFIKIFLVELYYL